MPPRSIVALVIVCWLVVNSVLVYREALPYWHAGGAPPYNIDLTEELSNSVVTWEIWQRQKHIGSAASFVERQRDRTFRLRTELRFQELPLPLIELKKIATMYHITEDGDLLGVSARFIINMEVARKTSEQFDLAVEGEVEGGTIAPRLSLNGQELPLGPVQVPLQGGGNVINPMQLLNRVPGLSEGRRWRMTLFDPISALGKAFPQYKEIFAAAEGMTIPELHAEVLADTLTWNDLEVPCYKIVYRKPGDPDPVAATWVRRRDALVLQQFSSSGLMEMTVKRVPER
jgi:hypothetical protein